MRIKDIALKVNDVYMLDPTIITEEPGWNARVEGAELDAHIRQLADSIKENGVKEPVTIYVKDEVVVLTNGHCRLMAVKLAISEGAEIKSIPCRVEDRYANDADRVLSLITRNSGKPLSPLEQASVVKRLLAYEWSVAEIAKKTGFSVSHVNDLAVLAGADTSVTKMVADGQVSATAAVKVVRKHKDKAPAVLREAKTKANAAGSSRVTEKHLKTKTAVPVGIDWSVQGPKLLAAVIVVRNAAGNQDDFDSAYNALMPLLYELESA